MVDQILDGLVERLEVPAAWSRLAWPAGFGGGHYHTSAQAALSPALFLHKVRGVVALVLALKVDPSSINLRKDSPRRVPT